MSSKNNEGEVRIRNLLGSQNEFRAFELPVRTAREAAHAIGCGEAEIGKSIVFRGELDKSVLVVLPGTRDVDQNKVASIVGYNVRRADPEFVREKSGYAIGGVPPIGHLSPPVTLLDQALLTLEKLWVAAGSSRAVFCVTPQELKELTRAEFYNISIPKI